MAEPSPRVPRVFVYVVAHDVGFAPHPFHRYCTLACCKPAIRRTAREGDWVVGLSPKALGHRLVYAMRVDEVLTFTDYWRDRRFRKKRPWKKRALRVESVGDNCYAPRRAGGFRQLPSCHSRAEGSQHDSAMRRDLSGERVLVSRCFAYFGASAPEPPAGVPSPGRGHRVLVDDALVARLGGLPTGRHGVPRAFVEAGVGMRPSRSGRGCV